jgi:hypothetical protein
MSRVSHIQYQTTHAPTSPVAPASKPAATAGHSCSKLTFLSNTNSLFIHLHIPVAGAQLKLAAMLHMSCKIGTAPPACLHICHCIPMHDPPHVQYSAVHTRIVNTSTLGVLFADFSSMRASWSTLVAVLQQAGADRIILVDTHPSQPPASCMHSC